MSERHQFFKKYVALLEPIYERPEAEELVYRLIDAHLDKTRLQFWDIAEERSDLKDKDLLAKFDSAIQRLHNKEPVQYIVGHTYFLDYKIQVNPSVLIPRQETEELVLKIIDREKSNQDLRILDIGTGSGCIPIALASQLNTSLVIALDISYQALEVAQKNIALNNVDVITKRADILSDEFDLKNLDLIVSNPPYVLNSDKTCMKDNVLKHEPSLALFVPDDDPLKFYKAIAEQGLKLLKPGGRLYFEIHERYGTEVQDVLESKGYINVEIIQDTFLSKDRMVFSQIG